MLGGDLLFCSGRALLGATIYHCTHLATYNTTTAFFKLTQNHLQKVNVGPPSTKEQFMEVVG